MRKKLATGYWLQACEALDTMQLALLHGNNNNVLTMGYQAMEHAAKALLAANDADAGSHHAVHVQVSLQLVKSGKADQEYSSQLRRAFRDRTKATYSASYRADPDQAKRASERTHAYLTKARAQLRDWGLKEDELEQVPSRADTKRVQPGGEP